VKITIKDCDDFYMDGGGCTYADGCCTFPSCYNGKHTAKTGIKDCDAHNKNIECLLVPMPDIQDILGVLSDIEAILKQEGHKTDRIDFIRDILKDGE
jgi:hypothetical protein